MSFRLLSTFLLIILCPLIEGCLDPYSPPATGEPANFLVVDGVLNSTEDVATIKLSRSLNLGNQGQFPAETGADVFVEDENGNSARLNETSSGIYSGNYPFDSRLQYRVRIETIDGKTYHSEFIELVTSNKTDSLSWTFDDTRLDIFVNSVDNTEGNKFYRYSFEETYQYNAPLFSVFQYQGGVVVPRTENINTCWLTQQSNSILIASTENLSENIISKFLIQSIPKGDKRLRVKYSLLLKQYPINQAVYNYWDQLKKITESLGGLFDPIPFQLNGNVSNDTDTNEIVLGYVYGGDVTIRRITINNNQLPFVYRQGGSSTICTEETLAFIDLPKLNTWNLLITGSWTIGATQVGYYITTPDCADCRRQGGTNVKPDFM